MFVAERFLSDIVQKYDSHPISVDGDTCYTPLVCRFLKLHHHIHSSYEKSIFERTIQYIIDITEAFDDYFHIRKRNARYILLKDLIRNVRLQRYFFLWI